MSERESDIDRAIEMFEALCPDSDQLKYLRIRGTPQSWSAVRPEDRDNSSLAAHLRDAFPEPLAGNVAVGCVFFRHNLQRIDVDNLVGYVMDAATGIVWEDDSQVTAQFCVVELDPAEPRTILVFGDHKSSLPRGRNALASCAQCGTEFKPLTVRTRYCSQKCVGLSQRGRNMHQITCEHCGQPFESYRKSARFCSNGCKFAGLGVEKTRRSAPKCETCGGPVSRREYKQCWKCKYPAAAVPEPEHSRGGEA